MTLTRPAQSSHGSDAGEPGGPPENGTFTF